MVAFRVLSKQKYHIALLIIPLELVPLGGENESAPHLQIDRVS